MAFLEDLVSNYFQSRNMPTAAPDPTTGLTPDMTGSQRFWHNDLAKGAYLRNQEIMARPALAQQARDINRDLMAKDIATKSYLSNPQLGEFGQPQTNQTQQTNLIPIYNAYPSSSGNDSLTRSLMSPTPENYHNFTSGLPTKANVFNRDISNKEDQSWITSLTNPALSPERNNPQIKAGAAQRTGFLPLTSALETQTANVEANTAEQHAQFVSAQERILEKTQRIRNNTDYFSVLNVDLELAKHRAIEAERAGLRINSIENAKDAIAELEENEALIRKAISEQRLKDKGILARTVGLGNRDSLFEVTYGRKPWDITQPFGRQATLDGFTPIGINSDFINNRQITQAQYGMPVDENIAMMGALRDKITKEPALKFSTENLMNPNRIEQPTEEPVKEPVARPAISTGEVAPFDSSVVPLLKKAYRTIPDAWNNLASTDTPNFIKRAAGGIYPSNKNEPLNLIDIALGKIQTGKPLTSQEKIILENYQKQQVSRSSHAGRIFD